MATIYPTEFLNALDEELTSVIKELRHAAEEARHDRIPNPPDRGGYQNTCYTHCAKCTMDRNIQKLIDIKVNLECGA